LSADGTSLAVRAMGNDDSATFAGQLHVFDLVDGDWAPVGSAINGKGEKDYFGFEEVLSAYGKTVAISGKIQRQNCGRWYISGKIQ